MFRGGLIDEYLINNPPLQSKAPLQDIKVKVGGGLIYRVNTVLVYIATW